MKAAQSRLTLCDPVDNTIIRHSSGQNTGVGSLSLLQGIVLTQESNWGLLHCRQVLYQLNYQGSPRGTAALIQIIILLSSQYTIVILEDLPVSCIVNIVK